MDQTDNNSPAHLLSDNNCKANREQAEPRRAKHWHCNQAEIANTNELIVNKPSNHNSYS
jgi:hypothetical protein